jgi:hypothetical protein
MTQDRVPLNLSAGDRTTPAQKKESSYVLLGQTFTVVLVRNIMRPIQVGSVL